MPRVICDLPNASEEISGVKFHKLEDGGLISDEISEELAELFASIPGYAIDEDGSEPPKVEVKPAPTTRKAGAKKQQPAEKPAEVVPPVVVPVVAETQPEPAESAGASSAGENEEVF